MRWDSVLKKISKKVSIKKNLSQKDVETAFEFTMLQVKNCIKREDMPKVLLKGFGTFKVSVKRMRTASNNLDTALDNGNISRENYENKKKQYDRIANRRAKEDKK